MTMEHSAELTLKKVQIKKTPMGRAIYKFCFFPIQIDNWSYFKSMALVANSLDVLPESFWPGKYFDRITHRGNLC